MFRGLLRGLFRGLLRRLRGLMRMLRGLLRGLLRWSWLLWVMRVMLKFACWSYIAVKVSDLKTAWSYWHNLSRRKPMDNQKGTEGE